MLEGDQLKQILISQSYLTEVDIAKAEKTAQTYALSLSEALLEDGLITRELLGQALAEHYGVPWLDLKQAKIDKDLLKMIPENSARAYRIIPVDRKGKKIRLAMVDPSDLPALHIAEKRLGERLLPMFIGEQDFEEIFNYYAGSLSEEFASLVAIGQDKQVNQDVRDEVIIKMVDLLLEKGYHAKASDIHIEPYIKKIVVRFRIDGVMHRMLEIDKSLADSLISRIKIMARLRTDERRSAQDGKIRFEVDGGALDVRVSIVPISDGENAVLRLLSAQSHSITLVNLGFNEADLKKVKKAISRPHGMILVTGPTGSGKTTTLYAVLNILNRVEVHIATIEDPVEYAIEGVSQIQVDSKSNLTFASGLRSILRQDPDIIMVGEIRDDETAGIAVSSALTGHLVLSTLHTNDAPSALPRLLDMGIEPFLEASTVNVVIAQRLVRKNCEKCRASGSLSNEEAEFLSADPVAKEYLNRRGYKTLSKLSSYKGVGCPVCDFTGYQGRIGIFEVLDVDSRIRQMIINKDDSGKIMEEAIKRGMQTMLEDGLDKALSGLTSIEEVLRVIRE